jgi:hypothetical protein
VLIGPRCSPQHTFMGVRLFTVCFGLCRVRASAAREMYEQLWLHAGVNWGDTVLVTVLSVPQLSSPTVEQLTPSRVHCWGACQHLVALVKSRFGYSATDRLFRAYTSKYFVVQCQQSALTFGLTTFDLPIVHCMAQQSSSRPADTQSFVCFADRLKLRGTAHLKQGGGSVCSRAMTCDIHSMCGGWHTVQRATAQLCHRHGEQCGFISS